MVGKGNYHLSPDYHDRFFVSPNEREKMTDAMWDKHVKNFLTAKPKLIVNKTLNAEVHIGLGNVSLPAISTAHIQNIMEKAEIILQNENNIRRAPGKSDLLKTVISLNTLYPTTVHHKFKYRLR